MDDHMQKEAFARAFTNAARRLINPSKNVAGFDAWRPRNIHGSYRPTLRFTDPGDRFVKPPWTDRFLRPSSSLDDMLMSTRTLSQMIRQRLARPLFTSGRAPRKSTGAPHPIPPADNLPPVILDRPKLTVGGPVPPPNPPGVYTTPPLLYVKSAFARLGDVEKSASEGTPTNPFAMLKQANRITKAYRWFKDGGIPKFYERFNRVLPEHYKVQDTLRGPNANPIARHYRALQGAAYEAGLPVGATSRALATAGIGVGLAGGGLGTGLVAGHYHGRSVGRKQGRGQGFDAGLEHGINTAHNAYQGVAPHGFLGRVAQLFSGPATIDRAVLQEAALRSKEDILKRLAERR